MPPARRSKLPTRRKLTGVRVNDRREGLTSIRKAQPEPLRGGLKKILKILLVSACCVVLLCVTQRHMTAKRITAEQIGAELVEAARSQTEDSLPLSTRLFPYIYIASRRMSLRAISRWLQEKHGVSLSAAAISRALSSPELHLQRLAESISAPAHYVASEYGFGTHDLLYGVEVENGPTHLEFLADHTHPQPESEHDLPRWEEMQALAAAWGPIPHEVQLLLEPYLRELLSDHADGEFAGDSSLPISQESKP